MRTATQIYHSALSFVEEADSTISNPQSTFADRHSARVVRDGFLSTVDGVTFLERLRRAAAEEAEREERTL